MLVTEDRRMRPPRRLFLSVPALLLAALSALPTSAEPAAVRSNKGPAGPAVTAEAAHYRIVTLPVPGDVVLEVGGLAFRSDGKLLACTRRGDVWLISHPGADDPGEVRYKRFA